MGAELAYRFFQQDHEVAIVDQQPVSFNNLPADFRGHTIEGDGLAQDVLRRAGIEQADGLAAVTNSDPLNAVVAYVASSVYQVARVAVRNYDSRWLSLHQTFGLPAVSSTIWGAQQIEALLHSSDLRLLASAGEGEVSFYQFIIPDHFHGLPLGKLFPEAECRIVALTRAGHAMLPAGNLPLETGDVVYISTTRAGIADLRTRLDMPEN